MFAFGAVAQWCSDSLSYVVHAGDASLTFSDHCGSLISTIISYQKKQGKTKNVKKAVKSEQIYFYLKHDVV